jgi:hypothetical protein
MCRYVQEDATSPEIQADAGDVKWRAGVGATDQDLVAGVWSKTQQKIQFLRDEASGAHMEQFLSQTYEGADSKPVVEILVRPRDMATSATRVGDCDDYSMYAACLLTALGIPCAFVTVAGDPHAPSMFTHVYVAAYPGGYRVPVDASHGKYAGWEAAQVIPVGRMQEWPIGNPLANCTGNMLMIGAAVVAAVVGWMMWGRG